MQCSPGRDIAGKGLCCFELFPEDGKISYGEMRQHGNDGQHEAL